MVPVSRGTAAEQSLTPAAPRLLNAVAGAVPYAEVAEHVLSALERRPSDHRLARLAAESIRRTGDLTAAAEWAEAGLLMAHTAGDQEATAWCLWTLSTIAAQRAEWGKSCGLALVCEELASRLGIEELTLWSLSRQAEVARIRGELNESARCHSRLRDRFERARNDTGVLWAVQGEAQCHLLRGCLDEAEVLFRQSLMLSRRRNDVRAEGWAERGLGHVLLAHGNRTEASTHIERAGVLFKSAGYRTGSAYFVRSRIALDALTGSCGGVEEARREAGSLRREKLLREALYISSMTAVSLALAGQLHGAQQIAWGCLEEAETLSIPLARVEAHLVLAACAPTRRDELNHSDSAMETAGRAGFSAVLSSIRRASSARAPFAALRAVAALAKPGQES